MKRLLRGAVLFLLAVPLSLAGRSGVAAGSGEAAGAPAAAEFASGEFHIELPEGLEVLTGEALAGYEAAALSDYPGAARTILAAASADRSAALSVSAVDSDADCLDAAREAAGALLRYPDAAREFRFGANRCAGFGCAVGEQVNRLYFLSDGAQLLLVAESGLDARDVERALASLRF